MDKVSKQVMKVVDSVESEITKVLDNEMLRKILLVLLVVYCVFFIDKIPGNIKTFLKSMLGKVTVLLLILYFAHSEPVIAVLLVVCYIHSQSDTAIENMENHHNNTTQHNEEHNENGEHHENDEITGRRV